MNTKQRPTCIVALSTEPSSLLVARQISTDCCVPLREFESPESVALASDEYPLAIFERQSGRIEGSFSPIARNQPKRFFPGWAHQAAWAIMVNPSRIREGKGDEVERFASRVRNCARQAVVWFFTPRFDTAVLEGENLQYPWGKCGGKRKRKEGTLAGYRRSRRQTMGG